MKKSLLPMRAMAAAVTLVIAGAASAQVASKDVRQDAPEQYTVVKGDTLWGISGKILNTPWKWPQLWKLNRDQIKNPHRIYPGDVIHLVRDGNQVYARMGKKAAVPGGPITLVPGIRMEDSEAAVETFSAAAMRHFMAKPLVVGIDDLQGAPKVVASDNGRYYMGPGSRGYVAGLEKADTGLYSVYREGRLLKDPKTNEVIGAEAVHVGEVKVLRTGELSLVEVTGATQEIGKGDRLMPIEAAKEFSATPAAASTGFEASIIAVHDQQSAYSYNRNSVYEREGGPLSVIVLNKGKADGVEEGHVLNILSKGVTVGRAGSLGFRNGDRVEDPLTLPDQENGHAMVFRVFDKISYAIVTDAQGPIKALDKVSAPE